MFTLPLYFLLFIYLAFLAFFFTYMSINFYHIIVSGSFTFATFVASFLCVVLTLLTLYFTFTQLKDVNWAESIDVFNTGWFNPTSQF